jgi:hypothetical protein
MAVRICGYRCLSIQNCNSNTKSSNHSLLPPEVWAYARHRLDLRAAMSRQSTQERLKTSLPITQKSSKSVTRELRSVPFVMHGVNGKGVYHPATVLSTVLCRANGAMSRFCATPEVNEAFGTSDPAILYCDLTTNLIRAFLYWMCTKGTFEKLDSLLSHSRH